jgi:hypothetical protein
VALTLVGIRVAVGSKLGGEVALWLGTIAAVARDRRVDRHRSN